MNCKICNTKNNKIFSWTILNKYNIDYFHCKNCWFLQTEEPYWLEEAYKESINIEDTWILSRNINLAKITSVIIKKFYNKNWNFLDFAWWFGIFTRLMRDIWFNFLWDDKYTQNFLAKWFEYNNQEIDLLTSFESFEHFDNPIFEVEKMLWITKNILFTTNILNNKVPNLNDWWYYWLSHWQHISFYQIKTLNFIANKYNLNFYTNWVNIHLFTNKKINNTYFKMLTKIYWLLPFEVSKIWMKSKSFDDMNFIINNKINNE